MVSSVIGFDEKSSLSSEKKILPNQSSSILNESSSSTTGITTTTSTNNDQISKLFPKCRPKNDCNLNNNLTTIICNTTSIITQSPQTSSLSSETSSTVSKSPNIGTNPFINNTNLLQQENINKKNNVNDKILSSGGGQYVYFMNNQIKNQNNKMLPNNIDGIQKYSQKRPGHNNSSKHNYYQYNQNPFIKDTTVERNIWERSRSTITNQIGNTTNVLSSPDLIEMETKMNYQQKLQHQQQQQQSNNYIKIERSPINKHHDDINTITVQKTDKVISDGEVLVFDDIDDEWEIKSNTEIVQNNDYLNQDKYTINTTNNDLSPKINAPDLYNSLEVKKIDFGGSQNMSGIIEYDGSPRKFGQAQQVETSIYSTPNPRGFNAPSTTLFPPRPGFPQRVNPTNSEILTTTTVNQFSADDTSNDVSEICTTSEFTLSESNKKSTFDYLYEFSETRKVLEEFFKNPGKDDDKTLEKLSDFNGSDTDSIDIHYEFRDQPDRESESYIGQRLAKSPQNEFEMKHSPKINGFLNYQNESRDLNDFDLFLDSASRSSGEIGENDDKNNGSRRHSRCFPYSPETTDYDSNCGDLDSEVSLRLIGSEFGLSGEFNSASSYTGACVKFYTSMPVLEDGLSSGHASDTENNNNNNNNININNQSISILMENSVNEEEIENVQIEDSDCYYKIESPIKRSPSLHDNDLIMEERVNEMNDSLHQNNSICKIFKNPDPDLESLYSIHMVHLTPPPPAPAPHRKTENNFETSATDVQAALMDIRSTLQRTKILPTQQEKITIPESIKSPNSMSPIWVPRCREEITSDSLESIVQPLKNLSADEDDADTDLETDRLLGHQRLDDMGFYDEKAWCDKKPRSLLTSSLSKLSPKIQQTKNGGNGISGGNGSISGGGSSLLRQGLNSLLPTTPEIQMSTNNKNTNNLLDMKGNGNGVGVGGGTLSSPEHNDNTTNKIIHSSPTLDDSPSGSTKSNKDSEKKKKTKSKEVLIEGVLFRARYLGSTQLVCEGQPTKSTRMMQAEEAVSRIKSPDGETQPSTEVDLFISTEKIMVLNTDLKEIMMDHALRTISYIADIGDLVVLMARRRFVPQELDEAAKSNRTPKMICHVFESEEAQFIAQSIGQAFQVAYMEFLKANGIEDHSFVKEMDYQEVLNSQEIFGDELEIFAKKELQKEVVVPKAKGEILGVVIVESGWGSMLPTVVIANLLSSGAAARCGQLNIGDQIIAINGLSLVGLPLSTCQNYIKNTKNQTVVKFTVVPCAPVVEVKIKRPNTKYQLGFSVQNGVICSLLRGGIAERGGVRVGHRIIEINNQSVVAVPHEKIVNLLATSVGEILMKTMPTSMFRLLTGQENPIYI